MELRPYQNDAVAAIGKELTDHRSTLLVMATGTGKTVTFGRVASYWPTRTLVLAHRFELIQQARDHLMAVTGLPIGLEQADNTGDGERIVVGSVQTMCKRRRLEQYKSDHFGLIVIDEAHHAPGKSYRAVLDYFANAKVLGVTATPDRLDKVALRGQFDSVAYVYDIADAIRDGWLVRIRAEHVDVQAIDLRPVGTLAGDFNQGDLDEVMRSREAIHGIVKPCLEKCGDRPTFVFTTSVANAEVMTEVFNAYKPWCARTANGTTGFDIRSTLLEEHRDRRFQYFVSVGIHTEGVDAPWVSCIALGRPTQSRSLFAQMVGRGTRPCADKSDLLVLDFVGNTGRHKLVNVADILGGRCHTDAVKKVLVTAPDGSDVLDLLDHAERELIEAAKAEQLERQAIEKERAALFEASVSYRCSTADLFRHYRIEQPSHLEAILANRPSAGQINMLQRYKIPIPPDLTKSTASSIIAKESARRRFNWATYGQVELLSRYGVDGHSLRFNQAKQAIDRIAQNGWQAR